VTPGGSTSQSGSPGEAVPLGVAAFHRARSSIIPGHQDQVRGGSGSKAVARPGTPGSATSRPGTPGKRISPQPVNHGGSASRPGTPGNAIPRSASPGGAAWFNRSAPTGTASPAGAAWFKDNAKCGQSEVDLMDLEVIDGRPAGIF